MPAPPLDSLGLAMVQSRVSSLVGLSRSAAMSDTSSISSLHDASGSASSSRPSGRKGNKKVRTGCITCKQVHPACVFSFFFFQHISANAQSRIRKVKCDEAKPSCLRCLKTGRKCDGYPTPKPRVSRVKSPSPTPGLETADELRAFDHYRSRSVALLGGVTVTGDEFWGNLVVKLAATEPAVRHAVLALSSLHESLSWAEAGARSPGSDFAFSEYGKAITAVRSWDIRSHVGEPAAIPLLVCVLFICIEFLLDYEMAAQLHICQGRLILSRMDQLSLSSPTMDMVRNVLVPIYARLSLATYLFGTRPEPIPLHLTPGGGDAAMEFESLREARDVLFDFMDQGLRFSVIEGKPAVYDPNTQPWQLHMMESTQQDILSKLSQWNAAFTVFKATIATETSASKATQELMYVYYHAATIWVSTALSPLETVFDDYEAGFAAIVSHASSVVAESGSLRREDAAFTFETEIVPPVYWVASKCRHPLIRRAALKLLQRDEVKRRRENLWRTQELAVIAAKLIEMEEGIGTALHNDNLSDLHAGPGEYWGPEDALKVPVTQQPTLPKSTIGFTPDQLMGDIALGTSLDQPRYESPSRVSPLPQDMEIVSAMPKTKPGNLRAPYGVLESQRIKNALIGPSKPGGVWITTMGEPQPGQLEWHAITMFLKV